jgi:hypothetical protein
MTAVAMTLMTIAAADAALPPPFSFGKVPHDTTLLQTAAHLVLRRSSLCLEVQDARDTNGAKLVLAGCKDEGMNGHQRWEYTSSGQIVSLFSGKCLDAVLKSSSGNSSADLQVWDCLGGDNDPTVNQAWDFTSNGLIKSRFDSRCIQVHGSAKDGAGVMMFPCTPSDQLQQFEIRDGVPSKGVSRTAGGCTCARKWSINGETFEYPKNCANPGGKAKSDWCFTDADEHCVGSSGTGEWDYCSVYRSEDVDVAHAPTVQTSPSTSNNNLRGTIIEHASSFATIPTSSVKQIADVGKVYHSPTTKGPKEPIQQSKAMMIQQQAPCIHGRFGGFSIGGSPSRCACSEGFAGEYCDECSPNHFNYPSCTPKISCNNHPGALRSGCDFGTCDFSNGKCVCPFNRSGKHCRICAQGFGGSDCAPGGAGRFPVPSYIAFKMFYFGAILCVLLFVFGVAKTKGIVRL